MIDIVQYRCQIGRFKQKIFSKKFLSKPEFYTDADKNVPGKNIIVMINTALKILVLCALILPPVWPCSPSYSWCGTSRGVTRCTTSRFTTLGTTTAVLAWSLPRTRADRRHTATDWLGEDSSLHILHTGRNIGNFWAKYVHGNIRRDKGIHNMHFNIRSLKFKVNEIKNIIYLEKPTIFGLSECELKKETLDPKTLKIPGYTILYPKSWEAEGFARVLVYVKKSFSYEQLHDLEDSLVQSVWLRGSFKNSKPIYFCHAYREHVSALGATINNQKEYLKHFLHQWEAATEHNSAAEPNEVHISGDMNLDFLPMKWLQPSYRLHSLVKLVNNTCNTNNFSQLVTEPTRIMYNSVAGTTEVSCIDHVYCNYRHRCSPPRIIVSGASDHDLLSYFRYSKGPSLPSRTIRRRSYKRFVEADFLTDLRAVDWTDVLATEDLDIAVDNLTKKLDYILNQHAPWIVFQLRKNFCPWLTEETKELMKERDTWKQRAKKLATANPGLATAEQYQAWGEYKKLRNKINNLKGTEENEFKKKKIEDNIKDTAKVWRFTKMFMNWKSTGSPSQLEENGVLITSARSIAQIMNNFFIDKVRYIRQNMALWSSTWPPVCRL